MTQFYIKPKNTRARLRPAILWLGMLLALALPSQKLMAQTNLYWDADSSGSGVGNGAVTNPHWNNYKKSWRIGSATGTLTRWISGSNAIFSGVSGNVLLDSDMVVDSLFLGQSSGTGYTIGGTGQPGNSGATNSSKKLYINGNVIKVTSTTQQNISCVLAGTDISIIQGTGNTGFTMGLAGPTSAFTGVLSIGDGTGTSTNAATIKLHTQHCITSCSRINFNDKYVAMSSKKYLDLSIIQGVTLNQDIHLNNLGLSQPYIAYLGATAGDTFTFNGTISGNADLWFQDGNGSGGAAPIYLNKAGTWTGNTRISEGLAGIFFWGVNDALPVTTRLFVGDTTNAKSTGELDLHGFNQHLAAINTSANASVSGITNNTATADTIFLTGNQYGTIQNGAVIGKQTVAGLNTVGTDNIALVLTSTATGTLTVKNPNTYSKGTVINGGTVKLTTGNNRLSSTGNITIAGGALDLTTVNQGAGTVKLTTGTITGTTGILTATSAYDIQGGTVNGILGGTTGLNKTSAATVSFGSNSVNTYTGATAISLGTLVMNGSTSTSSAVTVGSAATLGGGGNLKGTVLVDGTVQPGSTTTPVTLSTGALTLDTNGVYTWNINNATGSAGTGYDLLSSSGSITVNATSSKPFKIKVIGANTVSNFNNNNTYTWVIASGTSLSGFSASSFVIDTTGFTNHNPAGAGTWSIVQVSNSIAVKFTGGNPAISVTPSSLSFGKVASSSTSSPQSYTLSGTFLTPASGSISVTAPAGFEVSASSGSGYGSSVSVSYTGGTLANTTVYVHFKPNALTSFSGNITNSGGGATTQNVALSGQGIAAQPTAQSSISFGTIGTNSMTLNFSGGNGAKRILLVNTSASVSSDPVSATTYTASSASPFGTQIGSGNYVAYNSTGSSVTLTGLSRNHTYYFSVYDYNDSATSGAENYLTPGGTASATTAVKTYTWAGAASASYTDSTQWTPKRTFPDPTDILQFNTSGTTTVTNVPKQTIGQLVVSGGDVLNLQTSLTGDTLTIGSSLSVDNTSALNLNGTTKLNVILAGGATGNINGTVTLDNAAHTLQATDASALSFLAGASCTAGASVGTTTSVFGKVNLNSVVFAAGSQYISKGGANPFGAGKPSSCVVFQSGSWYSHQQSAVAPDWSGRVYANFEFNSPGVSYPSQGGPSSVTMDTLKVTALTLLDFGQAGGAIIKGDILANAGTITFDSASTGTVTFNGGIRQNISGAGTVIIATHSTFNISSGTTLVLNNTLTANANINVSGTFENGSGGSLLMGFKKLTGAGNYKADSNSSITIVNSSGLSGTIAVTGTKTFHGYANYIFNVIGSHNLGFNAVGATAAGNVDIFSLGNATLDGSSYQLTLNGTIYAEPGDSLVMPDGNSIKATSGASISVFGAVHTQSANGFSGTTASGASFQNFTNGNIFLNPASRVIYNGAAQNVTGQVPYINLIISGSGAKSQVANVTVDSVLTLKNSLSIGSNKLTLAGAAIAGTPANLSSSSSSSLELDGSHSGISIPASVTNLSKLIINNTNGVSLNGGLTVADTINMLHGLLNTFRSATYKVILGSAAQLNETASSYIYGKVQATRTLSNGTNNTFGNIGAEINAASGSAGTTVLTRTVGVSHSITLIGALGSRNVLKRFYDIAPSGNGGLNATVKFHYNTVDIPSGTHASSLGLFEGVNADTLYYSYKGLSSIDTINNLITLNSVDSLARMDAGTGLPAAAISGTATICNGGSTTLSVALTGTSPWTIKYSDGTTTTTAASITATPYTFNVSPTTTKTYTLTQVTDPSGNGTTTGSAIVTVTAGPSITTNPSGNTICSGNSNTFTVVATGTGLIYHWQESTNGGTTFSNITNGGIYSGATSTSLTLLNPGSSYNNYQYRVVVSTTGGCISTSSAATLSVNPKPSANAGSNRVIKSGTSTQIGATSTTGHTYSWSSSPSGFTSTTSNPTVSPTVSTTYTLVETITATGCATTNSVVVGVASAIYVNAGAIAPHNVVNTIASHAVGDTLSNVNGAIYPGFTCTNFNLRNFPSSATYSASGAAFQFAIKPAKGYAVQMSKFSINEITFASKPNIRLAYSTDGVNWTDNGSNFNATANGASCTTAQQTHSWSPVSQPVTTDKMYYRIYVFNQSGAFNETINTKDSILGSVYSVSAIYDSINSFAGNFGNVKLGKTSASSRLYVSGYNLTNSIIITAPTGFQMRTGTNAFSSTSIVLTPSSGSVANTAVDVRFAPGSAGVYNDSIRITCNGAFKNLAVNVTGDGINNTIDDPTNFTATGSSTNQIDLGWSLNAQSDSVILARNTTATFGTPIAGHKYNVGDAISGGGTIIHINKDSLYYDTSLVANTRYYYKMWSDSFNYYSAGDTVSGKTKSSSASYVYVNGLYNGVYTYADANATATNLVPKNGTTAQIFSCTYYNASGFPSSTTYNASTGGAIEFSITPNSGYQTNITGFHAWINTFNPINGGNHATSHGASFARLAYSTNGGTTWVDNGSNILMDSSTSCQYAVSSRLPYYNWDFASPIKSTGKVMFRIYAMGETNAADEFIIQSDSLIGTINALPVVTVDTTGFKGGAFGNVKLNTNSAKLTFHISGSKLYSPILITMPSGYQVKTGAGSYANTLTLTPSSGTVANTAVDVHFSPTVGGPSNGNVDISTANMIPDIFIPVSGDGFNNRINPTSFKVTSKTASSLSTGWNLNTVGDTVMLVYSRTNLFSAPVQGKKYNVGDTLSAGDSVVYIGLGTSFTHSSLLSKTTYYYKLFSDSAMRYSFGVTASDSTLRNFSITTDNFRSNVSSGNFATVGTWQSSQDSLNWIPATRVPDFNAKSINIVNGDSIFINTGINQQTHIYVSAGGVLTVAPSGSLIINTGSITHSIIVSGTFYVNTTMTAPVNSYITIASGGVMNISGSNASFINKGYFTNNGTVNVNNSDTFRNQFSLTNAGTFNVNNGGEYNHAVSSGSIPTINWATGSTMDFTGVTAAVPGNIGQNFYNLTWNCTNQNTFLTLQSQSAPSNANGVLSIGGDLNIKSTGPVTSIKALGLFDMSKNMKLTIGGNFILGANAQVELNNFSSTFGTNNINDTLQINGNLQLANNANTKFQYNFASNTVTGGGLAVLVKGNVTANPALATTGAGFIRNASSGAQTAALIFNGDGSTTQTLGGGNIGGTTTLQNITYIIKPNASVDLSTFNLQGTGTFTLGANATLATSSGTGLTGAISTTGTGTYDTAASYNFGNSGTTYVPGFSGKGITKMKNLTFSGSGTVNAGSNITINGVLGLVSSTLSIGANTLTLRGTITAGTGKIAGGATSSITISGYHAFGTIPFASGSNTLNNFTIWRDSTGSVNLGSDLTIVGTLALNKGSFNVNANTLSLNGAAISGTPNNLVTTSASSLSYGGSASGLSLPSVVTALNNLTLNNANGLSLNSNLITSGAITVTSGAFTIGSHTLEMDGGLSVSGTLTGGNTSNIIVGGAASMLTLPAIRLNDLTLNRANGMSLSGNLSIGDSVKAQSGILYTDTVNHYHITLDSAAGVSETVSSYVVGIVQISKYLASGVTNSFGNLGATVVTHGTNIAGATTVTRTTGAHVTNIYAYNRRRMKGANIIWTITPANNGNLNATIDFHYNANLLNNIVESSLDIFADHVGNGVYLFNGHTSQNTTTHDIVARATDSFSSWTLGGSFSNPLPVELMSFDAKLKTATSSELNWVTASEINNDHFEVERSENGTDFQFAGEVRGHGTVNTTETYSFMDNFGPGMLSPALYYRLKQVDFNGAFTYSETREVVLSRKADQMQAWFNRDIEKIQLKVYTNNSQQLSLRLTDMSGKTLATDNINVPAGESLHELDVQGIANGIYTLIYTTSEGIQVQKLLKY